ncbi:hypothetical protein ACWGSK_10460 [Nocardiopsis sp. NPDC055551]
MSTAHLPTPDLLPPHYGHSAGYWHRDCSHHHDRPAGIRYCYQPLCGLASRAGYRWDAARPVPDL